MSFTENFRSDGKRGACPYCGGSFTVNDNLRNDMMTHYRKEHPERILQAVAYMNKLDKEIAEIIKKSNYHKNG